MGNLKHLIALSLLGSTALAAPLAAETSGSLFERQVTQADTEGTVLDPAIELDALTGAPADEAVIGDRPIEDEDGTTPDQPAAGDFPEDPMTSRTEPEVEEYPWRGTRAVLARPAVERGGFSEVDMGMITAEALDDASVYGENDEVIAEVDDLVLGPDGQVQGFVMDVGGFLGIGSREVAVGFDEAQVLSNEAGDEYRVHIDATEEQLESLPEYQNE